MNNNGFYSFYFCIYAKHFYFLKSLCKKIFEIHTSYKTDNRYRYRNNYHYNEPGPKNLQCFVAIPILNLRQITLSPSFNRFLPLQAVSRAFFSRRLSLFLSLSLSTSLDFDSSVQIFLYTCKRMNIIYSKVYFFVYDVVTKNTLCIYVVTTQYNELIKRYCVSTS